MLDADPAIGAEETSEQAPKSHTTVREDALALMYSSPSLLEVFLNDHILRGQFDEDLPPTVTTIANTSWNVVRDSRAEASRSLQRIGDVHILAEYALSANAVLRPVDGILTPMAVAQWLQGHQHML